MTDLGLVPDFSVGTGMWIGLAAAIVVFGLFSALLMWHWKEYSTGKYTTITNMFVYLGVGVALLLTMALSALWAGQ